MLILRVAVLALLAACSKPEPPRGPTSTWSAVKAAKAEGTFETGTLGFGMQIGPSGKIMFSLGPNGSGYADSSPEAIEDNAMMAWTMRPWILKKAGTQIAIPGRDGFPKVFGLYENFEPDIWAVLSSPGCAEVTGNVKRIESMSDTIITKTYVICDVDKAVERLRAAAKR